MFAVAQSRRVRRANHRVVTRAVHGPGGRDERFRLRLGLALYTDRNGAEGLNTHLGALISAAHAALYGHRPHTSACARPREQRHGRRARTRTARSRSSGSSPDDEGEPARRRQHRSDLASRAAR